MLPYYFVGAITLLLLLLYRNSTRTGKDQIRHWAAAWVLLLIIWWLADVITRP